MTQRLLAIVTDTVDGPEPIEAMTRDEPEDVEVRLVSPAVEHSLFQHTLGDVDQPAEEARARLEASLEQLRRRGIRASGTVGDADPVLAAQDALREGPADEVVILERAPNEARWFEDGLFRRAQEEIAAPLKLILVETDGAGPSGGAKVVAVERAPAGTKPEDLREVEISENMPRFSILDLAGMIFAIVGTIVIAVLAAAGPGPETAAGAASILIAIGAALINMAHVVGLTLFQTTGYRGGFETFFRFLSLIGTPVAIAVNLAICLTS